MNGEKGGTMTKNNLTVTVQFDKSMEKDIREWISDTHIEKYKLKQWLQNNFDGDLLIKFEKELGL